MNLSETELLLWGAAVVALLAVLSVQRLVQVFRGPSGRPYSEVTNDLYQETERRSQLIAEWARKRERRLNRLERRS